VLSALPMKRRAWMSWSSGKDSAYALAVARKRTDLEIVALLTTVTETYSRVSMHGVRQELLHAQARATGLPLVQVRIPAPCSNVEYEERIGAALAGALAAGVDTMVFGDLYLADIREYREKQLARVGMRAEFPLWKMDTRALAREMIDAGVRAVLTCVDPKLIPRELAGRDFDESLLADLPATADPCGENGEFHTFAHAGPALREPVALRRGEVVERDGFVFADLMLQ
jgi:uncharacterized protein (TIGR00290 family)